MVVEDCCGLLWIVVDCCGECSKLMNAALSTSAMQEEGSFDKQSACALEPTCQAVADRYLSGKLSTQITS